MGSLQTEVHCQFFNQVFDVSDYFMIIHAFPLLSMTLENVKVNPEFSVCLLVKESDLISHTWIVDMELVVVATAHHRCIPAYFSTQPSLQGPTPRSSQPGPALCQALLGIDIL